MSSDLISESTLSQLGFPNEFPYEFDSTETEDETSDDEDDFFAGLTRRLALSTQRLPSPPPLPFLKAAEVNSAESTRGGLGSSTTSGNKSPSGPFSQAPSPPESPVREEVAKIKRSNLDSKPSSRTNPNLNPFVLYPQNAAFGSCYYWLQQPPQISHYHQSPIRFESTLQPSLIAFPFPVAEQPSAGTGVFTAPTAVKQPSVGTGVFLPKNHPNPSDSRKQGGGGCAKLPARVVQIQHLKTEAFSGRCYSRSQARVSTNSNILNLSSEIQFPKLQ